MSATKTHGIVSGAAEQFEFDEAEIWASIETVVYKPAVSRQRPVRKPVRKSSIKVDGENHAVGPSSLPVNIPDWSKILGREHRGRAADDLDLEGEDGEEDEGDKMPPHEYLARTRVASLSVHEGVGRTLKGRDLSRVRNAIWKQTGFELD